ncbi:tyrosine-type recombinase/integrase [Duganella sp. FT80W]|uniref:Tyrosine-type recombinase/integrase n=1 Tax=Duganella guangzhouensis TaxID=2666084 RepID=A0A6I2KVA4_9BURK|nr:tyrosine-type recombinase/integrase [Duganella guangzhouensis]MRW89037.1 tyrosine-type recombinase/integrase [Duganella guangzhouensis]
MRIMECLRLRVKDLEFSRNKIIIREGKDTKDSSADTTHDDVSLTYVKSLPSLA